MSIISSYIATATHQPSGSTFEQSLLGQEIVSCGSVPTKNPLANHLQTREVHRACGDAHATIYVSFSLDTHPQTRGVHRLVNDPNTIS